MSDSGSGIAAGAHELMLEQDGTVGARTAIVVTAATVDPPVTEPTVPTALEPTAPTASVPEPTALTATVPAGDKGSGSNNSGKDSGGGLASTGAQVPLPAGNAVLVPPVVSCRAAGS